MPDSPSGIVLYGIGKVGRAVADLCDGLDWPVVGAVNRGGPKIGKSLAEIYGCKSSAVVRESLDDALQGRSADIAVVGIGEELETTISVYEACMEKGLNVVTCGSEATFPSAISEEFASRLDRTARKHGVSFLGTGAQDTPRVGTLKVMAGMSTRIASVFHRSIGDVSLHGPHVAKLAGAGLTATEFEHARLRGVFATRTFEVFLRQCAAALGLNTSQASIKAVPVFEGDDETKLTLGVRFLTDLATSEGIGMTSSNDLRILAEGEEEIVEWSIDGDNPVHVRLSGFNSGHGTATQIVNRIPDVLAAAPGLITIDQLALAKPVWHRPS